MNNLVLKKTVALGLVFMMALSMSGCGKKTAQIDDEAVAMSAITYFTKGVYANYAAEAENPEKNYFYVFYGDGSGSIEDGITGDAEYFEYEVGLDELTFHIGSIDPVKQIFKVKSYDDNKVVGSFDDGIELVFEKLEDVDVESFRGDNYLHAQNGEDLVYESPNGWKVRYTPDVIQVNEGGPVTTFVYTGDCAGTCMITATYTAENKGKDAIKKIGEAWGSDTQYSEGVFPGTEDETAYYALLTSGEENGVGLNQTAIGRDYMDGALTFEFTVHNGGDEAMDIAVSDALSVIIDSIEFVQY